MTALSPGTSPPPVRIPIRFCAIKVMSSTEIGRGDCKRFERGHGTTANILRMKWVRLQIALLALIILAASGQCVVACATALCRDSAPPCHRHHPGKQSQSCTHTLLLAEARASTVVKVQPAPSVFHSALPEQSL